MKNENLKNFLKSVSEETTPIHKKMKWRQENQDTIKKSLEIVVQVLAIMREKKITQKDLAELMQVVPQRVHTILRGDENLTIETIVKLEKALQIKIIDVVKPSIGSSEAVSEVKQIKKPIISEDKSFNKRVKVTQRTKYNENEDYGLSLAA